MKKTIFTLVLIGFCFLVKAQNTFPATGKVGIGTLTPTAKLEVFGGGNLLLRGANNDAGDLIFRANSLAQLGRVWTNTSGISGLFLSSGDNTPDLTIDSNGKVGVGTSNPTAKLEVFGGGNLLLRGANNDAGDLIFRANSLAQLGRVWTNTSGISGLFLSSGDNTPDLTIDSNGKVGIGTLTPTTKLEVFGGGNLLLRGANNDAGDLIFRANSLAQLGRVWTNTSGISGLFLSSGDNTPDLTIDSNGKVGVGTSNPTAKLEVFGGGNLLLRGANNDAGDLIFRANSLAQLGRVWTNTSGISGLFLSSGDNTPDLTIDSNGKVGIGTTSTGSHKLAVDGSVGAREIKVEAIGWSDFVFNDDYTLPTLQEVEHHIKDKGHLKDIPSAKQVKENGILLGEMDAKLLQKIEELTLYIIQLNKRVLELEKENSQLKNITKR
jgi:hypothetical protein